MDFFKHKKKLTKKIILSNFFSNSRILDVEDCQAGMIVNIYGSEYLLLEWSGKVLETNTLYERNAFWHPHSGFSTEELEKISIAKRKE